MERRKVLAFLGGTLSVGLAGCLGDDDDSGDDAGDLGEDEFEATSTEGFVWFGEPDEAEAMEDALELPPQEEAPEPVVMTGEVTDDGTWTSVDIDFPPLHDLEIPQVPEVEAPGGFEGELDVEEELMTCVGQIRVTIPQDDEDLVLEFPLDATTGESGVLTGSFDTEGETTTVTIVDNETEVHEETGNNIIDQLLGLDGPAGESGANWFSLTLEVEGLV